MQTLTKRNAIILAILLSIVMWVTRGSHTATVAQLPDASWAIFFAIGFYFRQRLILPLFLAQAALIDYLAITHMGVDDYCVTPAYAFLLPAYSAMWLAGHWYAAHYRFEVRNLSSFALSALAGTVACELISSGSFYFLGGRFADTSMSEFSHRLVQFFPSNLAYVAMYLGSAALVHILLHTARRPTAAV